MARWCVRALVILGGALLATVAAWLVSSATASADPLPGIGILVPGADSVTTDQDVSALADALVGAGGPAGRAVILSTPVIPVGTAVAVAPAAVPVPAPIAESVVRTAINTVRELVAPAMSGLRATTGQPLVAVGEIDGLRRRMSPARLIVVTPANAGEEPGPGDGAGVRPGPGACQNAAPSVFGLVVGLVGTGRPDGPHPHQFASALARPAAGLDSARPISNGPFCLAGDSPIAPGVAGDTGFSSAGRLLSRAELVSTPPILGRPGGSWWYNQFASVGSDLQPGVRPD